MVSQPIANAVVDVVIPARNEQDNILCLLARLPRRSLRHVVVADNGSTDRTAELAWANGAIVVHELVRGYGSACLAALSWINANGLPPDIVAFLDADLSDDPALLGNLWEPIASDRADLVIASRPRLAQPGSLSTVQRFGNRLACGLIRLMTGCQYTDLGPMRAIRWSSLSQLNMHDRTWGWTVEMQFKAAVYGLRALEIDVPYRPRHGGQSKISGSWVGCVRAGVKILATLGSLGWSHRQHLYPRPRERASLCITGRGHGQPVGSNPVTGRTRRSASPEAPSP